MMLAREIVQWAALIVAGIMTLLFIAHSCEMYFKHEAENKVESSTARFYVTLFILVVIIFLFRIGFKS